MIPKLIFLDFFNAESLQVRIEEAAEFGVGAIHTALELYLLAGAAVVALSYLHAPEDALVLGAQLSKVSESGSSHPAVCRLIHVVKVDGMAGF